MTSLLPIQRLNHAGRVTSDGVMVEIAYSRGGGGIVHAEERGGYQFIDQRRIDAAVMSKVPCLSAYPVMLMGCAGLYVLLAVSRMVK